MGFFIKRSEIDAIKSHVEHLNRELDFQKRCYDAAQEKISHQKEQIDCIKIRATLCEAVLLNMLAKNVNCIVGWDYYLDRLKEIRATDPDSNPEDQKPH